MTFDEIMSSIRFKIDDIKGTRFSPQHLLNAVNEAYKHVYRELIRENTFTDAQVTTVAFSSTAQVVAFDTGVNNNIQKILHVQDQNEDPIPIVEEALARRSDMRSVYLRRTLVTGRTNDTKTEKLFLGWYKTPETSFTLSILYTPKAAEFSVTASGSDQLHLVPIEHHDVVVLRAVVLLLATDEDNVQTWMALYTQALRSMQESVQLANDEVDSVLDLQAEDYYARSRS